MSSRRLAWGAVALAASAAVAAWLGPRRVHVSAARGDWRGATRHLGPKGSPAVLSGRGPAQIHLHGLDGRPAQLGLSVSASPAASPYPVVLLRDGAHVATLALGESPVAVAVPIQPRREAAELELSAVADRPGVYLRVHHLELERAAAWWRLLVPALIGLAGFALLWRRGRLEAVGGGVLASALAAAGLATLVDPVAAMQFSPGLRLALRLAALACVWLLALAARPGWLGASLALAASAGLLYLPSLHYGFLTDDYYFGRPLSWAQLLSTLYGQWDPLGHANAHYRPVLAWLLAADYAVWGPRPAGFHLTSLGLHVLCGLAAFALLQRLVTPRAALAGALAWIAHPMAAATAAWANQRTDSVMAVFYLGALAALLHPRFAPRHAAAAAALACLALGSKEMAVTLPLAAALLLALVPPRPGRRAAIAAMAVLAALLVAGWVALFPDKAGQSGLRLLLDRAAGLTPGDLLRLVPSVLAPVFLPMDYARWRGGLEAGHSGWYLLAGAGVAVVLAVVLAARGTRAERRLAAVGIVWPLLTLLPLLPLEGGLDLYRLGMLPSFGAALAWSALASRLERCNERLAPLAAAALALALGWLSIPAGRAWGPGGFAMDAGTAWKLHDPAWYRSISPEMRRLFLAQAARIRHLQGGPPLAADELPPGAR